VRIHRHWRPPRPTLPASALGHFSPRPSSFCKPARCPSSSRPQGVAVSDIDPGHCDARQQGAGRSDGIADDLVGKSARNTAEFRDYSDSGPFELRNFHRNFIFPIVKCVPANLEHVPTGSESSPAIDSSDFMNRKTFPLYLSVASGIKI
jgi:hypothetical protein